MNLTNDSELLREVGSRLRRYRVQQNIPLEELARQAGLSKTTVSKLELGADFRVSSLLRILRTLNRLDALDAFLPPPLVSPMALVKQGNSRPRQRARRRRSPAGSSAATPKPSPDRPDAGPRFTTGTGVAKVGVPDPIQPAVKPPGKKGRSRG